MAHGRLMLTVLGGLAEFERELIRARTSEGRARAVANGVKLGRKPITRRCGSVVIRCRSRGDGCCTSVVMVQREVECFARLRNQAAFE
jgi:DNA invertase Pin-like site-specific DNA recombinase